MIWDEHGPLPREVARAMSTVRVCASLLNCLSGVCSAVAYETSYLLDSTPSANLFGGGGAQPMRDTIIYARTPLDADEARRFDQLFDGYERLSDEWKERADRALRRIAQAKGRMDRDDRALDLGIALEMALLSSEQKDQKQPSQLSNHFKLRGAWLLAETANERMQLFQSFGSIYDRRSQVAHSGFLSRRARGADVEQEHMTLAERVLYRLISQGPPPDWTSLILGAT